ncbi:hypothetical protein V1J52_16075 [Streptomyces sp. TRM 70351]|uniref:DUF7848 domain-containing protein n=1 Tax=Streptomyces sp. TRM 70351 TaxID=3116552 RepID=UPI002E7C4452|nr:hypothetical protein [Streptomyces sp. TRM 70351]MEE1929685.1 hypothetical protein [Streptomyces sp. TRM 70351]
MTTATGHQAPDDEIEAAEVVCDELEDALTALGIKLSVWVDLGPGSVPLPAASPTVDLGRCTVATARALTAVLRTGTATAAPCADARPTLAELNQRQAVLSARITEHFQSLRGTVMREVYAVRNFTVEPDREPDAEPSTVAMCCVVCGQSGPAVEMEPEAPDVDRNAARRAAAGWVRRHRDENREHFTYRLVEASPYRLVPGRWR